MANIFSFKPVDTLFFRGAEPMAMGESHSSNFNFPPPLQTIEGAIRTLLYFKDKDKYKELINIGANKGGFNVFGPMFFAGREIYVPAPYSWYREKRDESNEKASPKKNNLIERKNTKFAEMDKGAKASKIIKSFKLGEDVDYIKMKSDKIYWAKPENNELESIGGNWISIDDLIECPAELKIFSTYSFFETERHVGIAMKPNRTVRESHIYSFTHLRLSEDVEILFATDADVHLNKEEILSLGAEQRFGLLKEIKDKSLTEKLEKLKGREDNSNTIAGYMSLTTIKGDKDKAINKEVLATGKIQYLGGWDLYKGFHKDMVGYFPAGTVFENKICDGLVPIV